MPKTTDEKVKTADAEILRDLARAKAVFQLRTIETILRAARLTPTIQEQTSWK